VSTDLLHPFQVFTQFRIQVGTCELQSNAHNGLGICSFADNFLAYILVNNFILVARIFVTLNNKNTKAISECIAMQLLLHKLPSEHTIRIIWSVVKVCKEIRKNLRNKYLSTKTNLLYAWNICIILIKILIFVNLNLNGHYQYSILFNGYMYEKHLITRVLRITQ